MIAGNLPELQVADCLFPSGIPSQCLQRTGGVHCHKVAMGCNVSVHDPDCQPMAVPVTGVMLGTGLTQSKSAV